MNKLEQKIEKDMEFEGKIIKAFLIILVIAFIFGCGYMAA